MVAESDMPRSTLQALAHGGPDENTRRRTHRQHQPPAVAGIQAQPVQPVHSQPRAMVSRPEQPSQSAANASHTALDVCVDEEFDEAGNGPTPVAFPPSLQHQAVLPAYGVSRKENTTQPGVWTSARMKQKVSTLLPAAAVLEVYEDDEFQDTTDKQREETSAAPAPLRQQLEAHHPPSHQPSAGVSNACTMPPLPRTSAAHVTNTTAVEITEPKPSSDLQHLGAPLANQHVVNRDGQGYCASLLVDSDGQEVCFEELRAKVWRSRQTTQLVTRKDAASAQRHPSKDKASKSHASESSQKQQCVTPAACATGPCASLASALEVCTDAFGSPFETDKNTAATGCSTDAASELGKTQENPTQIAAPSGLAAASQDGTSNQQRRIGQDLAQPGSTHAKALLPCRLQGAAAPQAEKRNSTVATTAQQSHNEHDASAAPWVDSCGRTLPAAEPTITITTRKAFDALNVMFNGDLPTMNLPPPQLAADNTSILTGYPHQRGAAAADPTVTMSTRAALDAINGMFGSDDMPTAALRRTAVAEPTVTINTRAAIDAMNEMFCDEPVPGRGEQLQRKVGGCVPTAVGSKRQHTQNI